MATELSITVRSPRVSPTLPHVDCANESALPQGAGDPAFEIAGPAPFVPVPAARRRSRYAVVDALVTLAAIAGFVSALAALGVDSGSGGVSGPSLGAAMTHAAVGVTCAAAPVPSHGQASL